MKAFRQFLFFSLLITSLLVPQFSFGQKADYKNKPETTNATRPDSSSPQYNSHSADREKLSRALNTICSERKFDPFGSIPIDVMQTKPTLSPDNEESKEGFKRAKRLLPLTREFLAQALQDLGKRYSIPEWRINKAIERAQSVTEIKADPELRDNAAVMMSEPRTIGFGTIFLASLRSDEGMISVLAHEMTHLADGESNNLHQLFNAVGQRATSVLGFRVSGQRSEELTCDLIGVMVARYYVERKPANEPLSRRLSRALQHNCVDQDETDDDHLSPRTTMRAIMGLDPSLARDLLGVTSSAANQLETGDFVFKMERGTSLTISRPNSYHHRS